MSNDLTSKKASQKRRLKLSVFLEIITTMEAQANRPMSLEEIAKELGFNSKKLRSQLEKIIEKWEDTTLNQYGVQRQKIIQLLNLSVPRASQKPTLLEFLAYAESMQEITEHITLQSVAEHFGVNPLKVTVQLRSVLEKIKNNTYPIPQIRKKTEVIELLLETTIQNNAQLSLHLNNPSDSISPSDETNTEGQNASVYAYAYSLHYSEEESYEGENEEDGYSYNDYQAESYSEEEDHGIESYDNSYDENDISFYEESLKNEHHLDWTSNLNRYGKADSIYRIYQESIEDEIENLDSQSRIETINRQDFSRIRATKIAKNYDLNRNDLSLLTRLLSTLPSQATERKVKDLLDAGASVIQIMIVAQIRSYWGQSREFHMNLRGSKFTYHKLSWQMGFDIQRRVKSLDIYEIFSDMNELFEHWYESHNLYRIFPSFHEYLRYSLYREIPENNLEDEHTFY